MDRQELERAVGQMLMVGFDGADETPPDAVADALADGHIGGVVLFARNVESLGQVVALNEAIHASADPEGPPPFVAVDQEGGRVTRIEEGLTPIPPMGEIGGDDPAHVADVSEVIARELRTLGFNLNFAPVLDVDSNPDNPVIGDRAFSDDADEVARAGGAFLYGHNLAGVVPCGKHFPGHGDTDRDSHEELPVSMRMPEMLAKRELVPFRSAISAGLPMVMTAHVLYPALDTVHPATFSSAVVEDQLRRELEFDGVVVSDDLEMGAVAERYSVDEMVDLGLDAGLDVFLVCHTESMWRQVRQKLIERGLDNDVTAQRIRRSAERVRRLKSEFFAHQTRPWTASANWRDSLATSDHRRKVEG